MPFSAHHLIGWNVEVGHGRRQVQHRPLFEGGQTLTCGAQQPHVVHHAGEVDVQDLLAFMRRLVLGQNRCQHIDRIRFHCGDIPQLLISIKQLIDCTALTRNRRAGSVVAQLQHVEELLAAEVACERLQRLHTMHEYHRIAVLEEVLGGRGAARARTEVVDEAHGVVLQRNGRAAGLRSHSMIAMVICSRTLVRNAYDCSNCSDSGSHRDQHDVVLDLAVAVAELLQQ